MRLDQRVAPEKQILGCRVASTAEPSGTSRMALAARLLTVVPSIDISIKGRLSRSCEPLSFRGAEPSPKGR